jgi:hypothetical protein
MTDGLKTEKSKDILPYLLLIAIAGIGFNFYYKYDRYYLGEALIIKSVIIQDKPEYIYASKGTSRYTFRSLHNTCRFWLSEGALQTINDNDSIKKQIEQINIGDTIEIKIRKTDGKFLQDEKARLRVIELIKDKNVIISKDQVQADDNKWFYINFGFPVLCLLIWVIAQVRRGIKKKNGINKGFTSQ